MASVNRVNSVRDKFNGRDGASKVSGTQMESSNEEGNISSHVSYSELMFDEDTDKEIESFLRPELIPEKDVSQDDVLKTQHANEQTCSTTADNRVILTKEEVDGVAETKNCMQIETKRCEKRIEITETSPRKHVRKSDGNDTGIAENDAMNSLKEMRHSDDSSGSKTGKKNNTNVAHAKVKVLTAEAKSLKVPSTKTALSPMWDNYILVVSGIPPRDAGHLKKVLNGVLGDNSHRIRQSEKGATVVYLHFLNQQDMKVARAHLHNQRIANYKLTVTVDRPSGLKQKFEGNHEGPAVKRMRKQKKLLQFFEKSYEEQIELKTADIRTKLHDLNRYIAKKSPELSNFIRQRQLKHGGAICALDKFKDCSPSERVVSVCWFAVGSDKETGQLVVGIHEGNGHVRKLSSVKQNYPDHVVKIAEVFEEFVHTQGNQKMWHKLVIHTNSVQDLMLLVFLDCTNDELKRVHDEMKIFFTSGEGMKCHVTSVYIRDMNNRDTKVTALDLVLGEPCLEDTVAGLKLQLPPIKHLWNSVHGAETLCKVMEELLAPTKKTTVLEIGCGIGLVGLHLSKVAGEVLSVDTESTMEVAKKNAANNGITGCKYFGGKSEDMIQELVKEQTCDEICAVVMFCRNRSYKIVTALEQLRKVQHLNRLVLVEDKAFTFNTIQSLSALSNEKEMGNPFFPVKVAPVDWPNSKGYLLLFLLERIGRDDMGTFQMNDKSVPRKSEVHRKASASKKRYIRGKQGGRHLLPTSVWDRTVFLQQSCDVGPEIRAGTAHNSLFENTASNMQLQVAEEIQRAYFGAVGNVENVADKFYLREIMIENQRRQMEEEQRRQMEEVRIRQIQEEELNRRMLEAKRRQIQVEEEDWVRQVQEEEQRRRIRDEDWMRCIQENERRRQIEEEERRKIQEEEWRRQIQEEERKIHEEHRRRLQEEEWRRRIQEEEWRRPLLEELQKREMLTEERKRQIEEEWMSQMRGENYRGPVLEEAYRGQMEEERERKLVRMSSNLRSRNDMVEDLIADSLREAAIPQLSADAAQKVKHLVAEAIRSVGVANQDKRHDVSTSRGVGGIHPESTVSRFGRPDKEMPEAGVFEGGYSRQVKEVDYLHESRHDMYGGALQKHSFEQDDLKSQQYSLIRNQKISSETSLNLPSILDLKLKPPEVTGASSSDMQHLSRNPRISSETSLNLPSIFDLKLKPPELIGASSSDMQHPEDKCFLEVGNQRHGQVLTAQNELDINVTRGQQAGRFSTAAVQDVGSARRDRKPREFNAHMQLDRLADKQAADIFKRRSDLF